MASIIGGEMLEGENVSSGSRLEYLLPATLRTDWWCGGAGLYSLFSLDVTSLHYTIVPMFHWIFSTIEMVSSITYNE